MDIYIVDLVIYKFNYFEKRIEYTTLGVWFNLLHV